MTTMEDIERRLILLEEENKSWRVHYEEEQRRIKKEYDQGLIKIRESFKKAIEKVKLDFCAKKKAVESQYGMANAIRPSCRSDSEYIGVAVNRTSPNLGTNNEQQKCSIGTAFASQIKPKTNIFDIVYIDQNRSIVFRETEYNKLFIDRSQFSIILDPKIHFQLCEALVLFDPGGVNCRQECVDNRCCCVKDSSNSMENRKSTKRFDVLPVSRGGDCCGGFMFLVKLATLMELYMNSIIIYDLWKLRESQVKAKLIVGELFFGMQENTKM
ncbi:AAEL008168-PA [Aedes aegypti]|uniref:AAEL008168-PA n=1 Tax=Aedes aegypti TaxID=7159 RepID=Q16ZL2_AEDAE|nr:AAEL008168-PA [Aedes aegypti]